MDHSFSAVDLTVTKELLYILLTESERGKVVCENRSCFPDGGVSRISQVFVTTLINNTEKRVTILLNAELL